MIVTFQLCPVCRGAGQVSSALYDNVVPSIGSSATYAPYPVICRTCNGRGVLESSTINMETVTNPTFSPSPLHESIFTNTNPKEQP